MNNNNTNALNIIEAYRDFIARKDKDNYKARYEGNEQFFHASSAGRCMRKHYYSSTNTPQTNFPSAQSMRTLRLGSVMHEELQQIFAGKQCGYNSIYNIYIEKEITIPEYNVRGFYDLVLEATDKENPKVYLYDFKTIGNFGYKIRFSTEPRFLKYDHDNCNELQVATYGLAVKKKFGRLDGMFLVYFEKDRQEMKQISVPMNYLTAAENYWNTLKATIEIGVPEIDNCFSPSADWECKWSSGSCGYVDLCRGKSYER